LILSKFKFEEPPSGGFAFGGLCDAPRLLMLML
jgi:hypothetical protein